MLCTAVSTGRERVQRENREHVRGLTPLCLQGMCCRVEIEYDDEWGTVCDDGFRKRSAEVVCRQLKCQGGEVVRSFGGDFPGEGSIWMDAVNCAGDEVALSKCEFRCASLFMLCIGHTCV